MKKGAFSTPFGWLYFFFYRWNSHWCSFAMGCLIIWFSFFETAPSPCKMIMNLNKNNAPGVFMQKAPGALLCD